MNSKTCAINQRLVAATLAGFAVLAAPTAVRAQDPPPPPPSTDQSDQSTNPTYNGGVPATSTPAPSTEPPAEPEHHKRGLVLGINGGLFTPTSGKARDRFGNTWWSAGIGIGSVPKVTGHGNWDIDLRTQYQTAGVDDAADEAQVVRQ